MRLETKKYLLDIQQAAALASEFVAGRTFQDYRATAMLRAAVERQREIIGEALAKLAKADEPVAARITDHRRIIAFRNILIHGYTEVDHRLVWDVVQGANAVRRSERIAGDRLIAGREVCNSGPKSLSPSVADIAAHNRLGITARKPRQRAF